MPRHTEEELADVAVWDLSPAQEKRYAEAVARVEAGDYVTVDEAWEMLAKQGVDVDSWRDLSDSNGSTVDEMPRLTEEELASVPVSEMSQSERRRYTEAIDRVESGNYVTIDEAWARLAEKGVDVDSWRAPA